MKPAKKTAQQKPSVRLPQHCVPIEYQLTIQPDLESFTFVGEEVITIHVEKSVARVVLHAADLEVTSAEYVLPKQKPVSRRVQKKKVATAKALQSLFAKISYNEEAETVALLFPHAVPVGKAKLRLTFRGVLNDKLRGYYRSTYTHGEQTKYLATTQFEATDARRAFPCFDEPSLKAVFHVQLIVPDGHAAISNTMPVSVREHGAGLKVVSFEPTPRMSTYLLAFVSGEFEHVQKKTKSGVLVRVFTTPGKKAQTAFALDCAVRCLEFYQAYFEIKYPLPVLDLLAIPDFAAGAMENWGAVTFREADLLIDGDHSALATRQRVALVVTHELAHQWFGNLVTMEWWTHLWLNEGFASYMEYVAMDVLYPEWNVWEQYMLEAYAPALALDQLASTHPIEVPVHHPHEIDEIFDEISYKKGSSVIRMLAQYVGPEVFRHGLGEYLRTHAYKNATTQDLWAALEKVSGKPVRELMHAWTTQSGYPVISFTKTDAGLQLSQQRHMALHSPKHQKNVQTTWPVPVSFLSAKNNVDFHLLQAARESIAHGTVVKLNHQETGFYRVAYSTEQLAAVAPLVRRKKLSVVDRWGLLANAFAMAVSGKLPLSDVLEFAQTYRTETEGLVLSELVSWLGYIGIVFQDESWHKAYGAYVRYLLAPVVARLGWSAKKGEPNAHVLLRERVLLLYGLYGDEQTVAKGLELCAVMVKQGVRAVPADIRTTVYALTAYAGGAPELEFLQRLYREAATQEEQHRLIRGMVMVQTPKLLTRAFAFGFSQEVRVGDSWMFLLRAIGNPMAGNEIWKFISLNWPQIHERYGTGGGPLVRTIQSLQSVRGVANARAVRAFFQKRGVLGAERALDQSLEQMVINEQVRTRESKQMGGYLKAFVKQHDKNSL
ncbi:MAG: M1 family metallopeptidase [Candidatus Doudnabacteria bacterium]|nr:M1 family metallopeptidase [Candidatus Doudnabacteria bacterium]